MCVRVCVCVCVLCVATALTGMSQDGRAGERREHPVQHSDCCRDASHAVVPLLSIVEVVLRRGAEFWRSQDRRVVVILGGEIKK